MKMRVFVIFALVQLAGILSTAMAQEPTQVTNALNWFTNFSDHIDYNFMKSHFTVDSESAEKKCERIGGPNAHDIAVEGARIYFDSVIPLYDTTQAQIRAAATYEPNRRLDFTIQKTCEWARDMENFNNDFLTSFGHCWTLAERDSIHRLKNLTYSPLNYICENGGSDIREFIRADGYDCMVSKFSNNELGTCFNAISVAEIFPIQSHDPTAQCPWSAPVMVPTTDSCLKFARLQRCSVEALQGCEYSTPANIINSLFEIARKSIGCEVSKSSHIQIVIDQGYPQSTLQITEETSSTANINNY